MAASAPDGRTTGRKVRKPPPDRVTTNSTNTDAPTARSVAEERSLSGGAVAPGCGAALGPGLRERPIEGSSGNASNGDAAATATGPKCPADVSATAIGTLARLGMATARP